MRKFTKHDIDQNYKEAAKWFSKASEKGAVVADLALGKIYYEGGNGVTSDYREAIKCYLKAAEKKSVIANLALGQIYYNGGNGIISDYEESFKWHLKAAGKGDYFAKYRLGQMYLKGKAVPQDGDLAVKWLTESAKDGYAEAAMLLVEIYAKLPYPYKSDYTTLNKGNNVSAYMWWTVANMLGKKSHRHSNKLKKQLTSEQIKQAQQKASEFAKDIKHIKEDKTRAKWG